VGVRPSVANLERVDAARLRDAVEKIHAPDDCGWSAEAAHFRERRQVQYSRRTPRKEHVSHLVFQDGGYALQVVIDLLRYAASFIVPCGEQARRIKLNTMALVWLRTDQVTWIDLRLTHHQRVTEIRVVVELEGWELTAEHLVDTIDQNTCLRGMNIVSVITGENASFHTHQVGPEGNVAFVELHSFEREQLG